MSILQFAVLNKYAVQENCWQRAT